ncbi:MAG: hypothetical protein U1E27_02815 [Kiritimatiellia bacterium]|nr:hypothetical protein [Kiritimatiellia bacterium]
MARLGDILVRLGRLTRDQAEEAARNGRESGRRLGEILLAEGLLNPRDLLEALAEQWSAPFRESIPDEALDPERVR